MKVLRDALASGAPMPSNSGSMDLASVGTGGGGTTDTSEDELHASSGSRVFRPGVYTWPIQIPVPATLPPSLSAPFGRIAYALKATVARPGALTSNLTAETGVRIVQCLAEDETELSDSIIISREWESQLAYTIGLSGKASRHLPSVSGDR